MEEVPRVRAAIEELLRDVEPEPFRERLLRTVEGRPPTPGVLTIRTARAVDGTVAAETAADRAAGVQLTYEGLRLTRRLLDEEPWAASGEAERDAASGADASAATARTDAATRDVPTTADDDPDVDLVAAEVLVAKGLNQLAHTGVRERVVEIVQRFGRVNSPGGPPADPPLESDFVVLAVAAGADLAAQSVPPGLVEYARDLARDLEAEQPPADALADVADDVERIVAAAEPSAEDRSRSSTMDP